MPEFAPLFFAGLMVLPLVFGMAYIIRNSQYLFDMLGFGIGWGCFATADFGCLVLGGLSPEVAGLVVLTASSVGFLAPEVKKYLGGGRDGSY